MSLVTIGIADLKVSNNPEDTLVTYSLGSCIGLAVYDPMAKVGGILHYMLPDSSINQERAEKNPAMFANKGIPLLFKQCYSLGADKKRMIIKVAGGSPDIFSDAACQAVYFYSNGVPRLINLICDTVLVYGYAEQQPRIYANLVTDVAKEKQQGGIFPTFDHAEEAIPQETAADIPPVQPAEQSPSTDTRGDIEDAPEPLPATLPTNIKAVPEPAGRVTTGYGDDFYREQPPAKKKLRIGLCAEEKALGQYLSRLLESYGFDVTHTAELDIESLGSLDASDFDVLLIDRWDDGTPQQPELASLLANWDGPVLYNDAIATGISLQQGNPDFGMVLADKINSLANVSHTTDIVVNH